MVVFRQVVRVFGALSAAFCVFAGVVCVLTLIYAPAIADHCGVTIMSPALAAGCFCLSLVLCVLEPRHCRFLRTRHEPTFDKLFPPNT